MEVSHEVKFGKVQYDPIYAKLCNVCMKARNKKTSGRIILNCYHLLSLTGGISVVFYLWSYVEDGIGRRDQRIATKSITLE